ncbi:MAG: TRAP transporter small permease [Defluviitaleaceae bacterium]|nr:TRAP transporter small permease [Defluviitaleaceae bacterium]
MKFVSEFIKYMLVVLLVLMFSITFIQVVMRYVFLNAIPWAEEAVRFMFVWASFIGAAIGIKEKIHIGIDLVTARLPQKAQRVTSTVVYFIIMWLAYYMVTAGWEFTRFTHAQLSPALTIPMSYVHVAIPISGVLIIIYSSIEVFKLWKKPNQDAVSGQ